MLFMPLLSLAQVGINTTTPNAMLDIDSDEHGILIPRVALLSASDATTVVNPQGGALEISTLIYNTATASGVIPGFYYWNGTLWVPIGGGAGNGEFESIGGVVRNTTNTAADHFVFGSTSLDNITGSGDDRRMFFNKAKGAFRAGSVTGPRWDDVNVGSRSVAFGSNTMASGDLSTAFGSGNVASGNRSNVFGAENTAGSMYETVFGPYAINAGGDPENWVATDRLFAIGNGISNASRSDAFTILKNGLARLPSTTIAMIDAADGRAVVTKEWVEDNIGGGNGEFESIGGIVQNTTNTAGDHFVFGSTSLDNIAGTDDNRRMFFNKTKGAFRAGEVTGTQWNDANVGNRSVAFGHNNIASGTSSSASGLANTASGSYSTAFGSNNTASGMYSMAFGEGNTASGISSGAFGAASSALANYSTAFGMGTTASNVYATAFGYETTASGITSLTFGTLTTASGTDSAAFGYGNTADTSQQTVFGRFNVIAGGSPDLWDPNDQLFAIGNGDNAATRSNALTILKNGRMGLQSVTNPTYALQLPNSDTNGVGRAQANQWATYSDGRVKTNRTVLPYGLKEILQIEPLAYFHHNSEVKDGVLEIKESGAGQIGFIAQDMYQIIPEIVGVPEDETTELWGISYDKLTPVLVKAIQEQQEIIDAQNQEINSLKEQLARIDMLEARLNEMSGLSGE